MDWLVQASSLNVMAGSYCQRKAHARKNSVRELCERCVRARILPPEGGRLAPATRFGLWGFLWGLQLRICIGLSQSVAGGKSWNVLIISTFSRRITSSHNPTSNDS